MLLTSSKYALFVLGAFCLYYLVGWVARRAAGGRAAGVGAASAAPDPGARPERPDRGALAQNLALLILGYGFYALWDWRWCFLLAGITASGLLGAHLLTRLKTHRKLVLTLVVLADLVALGFFKYFDFFSGSLVRLFGAVGLHPGSVTLGLVLPVGLSYYVFQNLSYVIDAYRGQVGRVAGPLEYAVALSFFPALLAGPITRPRDLVPQLARRRDFDDGLARDGLRQILWGLAKKLLIADSIGLQVDHVWGSLGRADGLTLAVAAVLYSLQIYLDFSGYADIAIGTGKLLGLRLSKNFAYPYFATSVREFWRRWHITLSSWMRDYLYIPLGGSRVGAPRLAFNVVFTFLVVGLWHGAAWTFVIWGALHGAYLAAENLYGAYRRRRGERVGSAGQEAPRPPKAWRQLLQGVLVFALITIAWVFFRAPSLGEALHFLGRGFTHPWVSGGHLRYLPSLLVGAALLLYEWSTRSWEHGLELRRVPLALRWAVYLVLCLVMLLFAQLGGQEGIYVQF